MGGTENNESFSLHRNTTIKTNRGLQKGSKTNKGSGERAV